MFYAKQSQSFDKLRTGFQKSQMDAKLNITRDYEKNLHRTFGENKPNFQKTEVRSQKTEDGRQKPALSEVEGTEDSGEKIGLTMVYGDIIVLAFIEVMNNTCGRAIGAEYGQK
jgi:hypothetical protein